MSAAQLCACSEKRQQGWARRSKIIKTDNSEREKKINCRKKNIFYAGEHKLLCPSDLDTTVSNHPSTFCTCCGLNEENTFSLIVWLELLVDGE